MSSNSSIININGNRYDAKTGKLLPTETHIKKNPARTNSGLVMDGIVRPKKAVSATLSSSPATSMPASSQSRSVSSAKNVHQRASRSQTLHRQAVNKPKSSPAIHNPSKTNKHLSNSSVKNNLAVFGPSPQRLARAENSPKSQMVQRFVPGKNSGAAKPTAAPLQGEVLTQNSNVKNSSADIKSAPVLPSAIASATHGNIDDLVDKALSAASSHKQKPVKKTRLFGRMPRMASVGIAVLAIFVLAGFFAYQYIPNVAVRVASSRAGIDAALPEYQPSGFAFKNIQASPGTVTVNYVSNGDSNRQYKIMQKSSNWDSQSLFSNYVSQESKNVQTSSENGRTVYMYGSDSATWVNKGIWYVIEGGTAELNSDQLLKIASSI